MTAASERNEREALRDRRALVLGANAWPASNQNHSVSRCFPGDIRRYRRYHVVAAYIARIMSRNFEISSGFVAVNK